MIGFESWNNVNFIRKLLKLNRYEYCLSSKNIATYFCFNKDLPPFVSSLQSKNTLWSPAKTMQFSSEKFIFFRRSLSLNLVLV